MSDDKVDIVIQGIYNDYTDEIIELYLTIPFVNNIIVSCWQNNKESTNCDRVTFVRNVPPESAGTDNRNMQIVSSLNGLKKCQSKFSIKTRSDQKFTYDSMMNMYDFYMKNNERALLHQYDYDKPKNKILVAGIYSNLLFSPRDHIFWGNTQDLIDLFDIPLEKNGLIEKIRIPKNRLARYYDYFIRTETYIGVHYCSKFNDELYRVIIKDDEHLYDHAIYWYYTKDLSNNITPLVFKSFPKSIIQLDWSHSSGNLYKLGRSEECSYLIGCSWDENGF